MRSTTRYVGDSTFRWAAQAVATYNMLLTQSSSSALADDANAQVQLFLATRDTPVDAPVERVYGCAPATLAHMANELETAVTALRARAHVRAERRARRVAGCAAVPL